MTLTMSLQYDRWWHHVHESKKSMSFFFWTSSCYWAQRIWHDSCFPPLVPENASCSLVLSISYREELSCLWMPLQGKASNMFYCPVGWPRRSRDDGVVARRGTLFFTFELTCGIQWSGFFPRTSITEEGLMKKFNINKENVCTFT